MAQKTWDAALKSKADPNPGQTWKRNKDKAETAIRDLTLLARRLPADKFAELFSADDLIPLMDALLGFTTREELKSQIRAARPGRKRDQVETELSMFEHYLDVTRAAIAGRIGERCLQYCIEQFEMIEPISAINGPLRREMEEVQSVVRLMESQVSLRKYNLRI